MKTKMEYSKLIVLCTGCIFISQIVLANFFAWYMRDTSIFSFTIPTTGGVFSAAIAFYLNKAKIENVCKGKIKFFMFKMNYLSKHPDHKKFIENELDVIDDSLTGKVDSEIDSSISEDIII